MGTSGAYGGSGRNSWERARRQFDDLLAGNEEALAATAQAVAEALADEDPELTGPEPDEGELEPLPVVRLERRRPGIAIAGVAGPGLEGRATVVGGTASVGRSGGGSRRRVVKAARRGALTIAAAYAIRAGDRETLAEIGLNLDELAGMSPRMQRQLLLDAILGDAGHPDDVVLRQAADEFLKSILGDAPPSPLDALRRFVASLIFKLALVELKQRLKDHDIDASEAWRMERRLGEWMEARLAGEDFGLTGGLVRTRDFQTVAMKLARTGIAILRAGGEK